MDNVEVAACLATLSAAVTALVVLMRSGLWRLSYGMTGFVAAAAVGQALVLWRPETFWTPEAYAAWDACLALLGVVAGLELGRGVLRPAMRIWSDVCSRAALLLVPLAAIGVYGLSTLGTAQRVGYRGQLVVDASVAGLLALVLSAVSLYELPRHPLVVTGLRGLGCYFTVQVIYLGSWEASQSAAQLVGWAVSIAFVWAMLAIAREAVASTLTPVPSVAGVSK